MRNLLITLILALVIIAFNLPAQAADRKIHVEYKNSEVSFVGDESFITGRYTRKPLVANHIWNERITFSGGVLYYGELNPGYFYTGQNAGIETFRDIFNRNRNFKKRGMSITVEDIKELSNENGNYYLTVKDGEKSNCGMAKQFSGDISPNGGAISVGNRVGTLYFCKSKAWGGKEKMITHIKDIMDRARYDEGALNKQRSANK